METDCKSVSLAYAGSNPARLNLQLCNIIIKINLNYDEETACKLVLNFYLF